MSITYKDHWNALLDRPGTQAIDVIASMKEETINEFLKAHFKYDKDHYTLPIKRTFDANGTPRTFWLTVTAEEPVKIGFPPFERNQVSALFETVKDENWTPIEQEPVVYRVPQESSPTPNILIGCPRLSFLLEWEKLDGTGNWELKIDSIEAIAKGFLEVIAKPEGSSIKIHPTKVYFDKADRNFATNIIEALEAADPDLVSGLDEKFRDLVVILLNVAATQATPSFIREIPIPMITIKNRNILLSYLNLENKMITIGASLDTDSIREAASKKCQQTLSYFNAVLEEDMEDAGGIEVFYDSNGRLRPDNEIDKLLPRTTALVEKLENANKLDDKKSRKRNTLSSTKMVSEGMAIGINEYFCDTLANAALPSPTSECTGWAEFVGVRGRACWWTSITNADTAISDTGDGFRLSGSVAVDIGGALEGCIKKFWDCSWTWACERFGLALRDRPAISIDLKDDGQGILLVAHIIKMPKLEADLPFPFDKVVEFLGNIIIKAIQVVLNLILSMIQVRIVPKDIALPIEGHHTGFELSNFDSFYFKRSDNPFGRETPENKLLFGAYAVAVTPKKI